MPKAVNTRRKYDSSNRKAQARETRRKVLAAAKRLFFVQGYTATTMEAIADAARVSVETVYVAFGSKDAVLSGLIDVELVGDDEPVPMLERDWVLEVRSEEDQQRQVRLLARNVRRVLERAGPIHHIIRSAASASPEIAKLAQWHSRTRLKGQTEFVRWVAANGRLRGNQSVEGAAQEFWALASPELHHLLTVALGWSHDRYEKWLARMLRAALLDGRSRGNRPGPGGHDRPGSVRRTSRRNRASNR